MAATAAVAALLAACGGNGGDAVATSVATEAPAPAPATSTGTAPTASATTVEGPAHDVVLWFVRNGQLRPTVRKAPETAEVARQAVDLLLLGPTAEEEAAGLSSQIVTGARLNAIAVRNEVATVDLSADIQAVVADTPAAGDAARLKLGQIVRTLMEFRTIKWVRFSVDGLEQTFPAPGDGVYAGLLNRQVVDEGKDGPPWIEIGPVTIDRTTVHFAGTADVFEGALQARLVQDGKTLIEAPVQASCGTGCRGSYLLEFSAPEGTTGKLTLEVYSTSAEDGAIDQIARRALTLG
ncbi:MAG: hypothetical protein QOE98_2077 [Gaiellaceae bacterium]|nr:hypothetical protein [Gaiellaceae bacterium]